MLVVECDIAQMRTVTRVNKPPEVLASSWLGTELNKNYSSVQQQRRRLTNRNDDYCNSYSNSYSYSSNSC